MKRLELVQPYVRDVDNLTKRLSAALEKVFKAFEGTVSKVHVTLHQYTLRQLERDLLALLMEGQASAHIIGAARHLARLKKAKRFGLFEESVAAALSLLQMTEEQFELLIQLYGQDAVQIVRGISYSVNMKLAKAVFEIVSKNLHVEAATEVIRKAFNELGLPTALAEQTARTQLSMAYSAGRWQINQLPHIQKELWGFEYVAILDDRVRPAHEAMNGVRAEKDDGLWDIWWPPNGFNCRCSTLEIWKDETDLTESSEIPLFVEEEDKWVEVRPDEGFEFNPGKVKASLLALGLAPLPKTFS